MGGAGTRGGDGQWGGADWEGETGRGTRAGKGQEWGGEHGGVGGEGETKTVRLGVRNGEGEMGKGAMGRGDGEGLKGRGRWERGQIKVRGRRRGKRRGDFTDGYDEMSWWKEVTEFSDFFTRATPGTPASLY